MNITVLGLWHLGSVTAACTATRFPVTGLDFDPAVVQGLASGTAPIAEPGLDALIADSIAAGRLGFSTDAANSCADADILWLCADAPVDADDVSDVESVLSMLRKALAHLPEGRLVLISSQLPVGTIAGLEREFPGHDFACCPENLRLGKSIDVFMNADRYVIGIRNDRHRSAMEALFSPFTQSIIFMGIESAEMVKHSINSFLALSITFINEIARLCELTGADAAEVAAGLKSDIRIGPKAYLGPGGPFAGGTLARDVVTLSAIAESHGEPAVLIPAIKASNDRHRGWALRKLRDVIGDLSGKSIAILGLTYKPGTDTLRRSSAIELAQDLLASGSNVSAFDPLVTSLPAELSGITLGKTPAGALTGTDAAVVCTEWPMFRETDWAAPLAAMKRPVIIDANRFLEKFLPPSSEVEFHSVGRL